MTSRNICRANLLHTVLIHRSTLPAEYVDDHAGTEVSARVERAGVDIQGAEADVAPAPIPTVMPLPVPRHPASQSAPALSPRQSFPAGPSPELLRLNSNALESVSSYELGMSRRHTLACHCASFYLPLAIYICLANDVVHAVHALLRILDIYRDWHTYQLLVSWSVEQLLVSCWSIVIKYHGFDLINACAWTLKEWAYLSCSHRQPWWAGHKQPAHAFRPGQRPDARDGPGHAAAALAPGG